MRRNQSISTARKGVRAGRKKRIRIPQPTYKALRVAQRKTVDVGRDDPPWFVMHRRGMRRLKIGENPLELRAVSRNKIRGTLPERIVYKRLIQLGFKDKIDFTFQTSMQGGRMELGGIVADFVFPYMRMVLQVQGPTHSSFLRMRKDQEQTLILSEMGFDVVEWTDVLIYDTYSFENAVRRVFGLLANWGSGGVYSEYSLDNWMYDVLKRSEAVLQQVSLFVGRFM